MTHMEKGTRNLLIRRRTGGMAILPGPSCEHCREASGVQNRKPLDQGSLNDEATCLVANTVAASGR